MNACFRQRARSSAAWLCLATALASTGCAASMAEAPAAPPMDAMAATNPGQAAAMNGPAAAEAAGQPGQPGAPVAPPAAPSPATAKGLTSSSSAHGAKEVETKSAQGVVEQMLIFTGRLELVVAKAEMAPTLNDAIEIAAKRGGYIHEQTDQSVTLRVPSAQFRQTLRAFEELGEVTHRSVQAQDVTEKYFDLGVRLKSLHATRDRLERFLDRAKTIEEVLKIEQELRRLNTEIDKLEGQRRYLSAQAAYSTITVTLRPKPEPQVIVKDDEVDRTPPPPPPPKTLVLPIEWFGEVSLDRLLELEKD